ncbi:MAG: preprotein translocase subunit Sec61beta [Thermoplasmata archaeon]
MTASTWLNIAGLVGGSTMAEQKNRGFSSAAGLIQYYDMEETRAVKIDPYIVMALGLGAAIVVEILNWKFV